MFRPSLPRSLAVAIAGSALVAGIACTAPAQPAATVTPAASAPKAVETAVPAAPKTVETAVPAAASPAATTPAAASTPAAQATAPAATTPAAAGQGQAARIQIGQGSSARFTAEEQLAGRGLNVAIGNSTQVTGEIVLGPDGQPVAGQSRVTIPVASFATDSSQRDNFIRSNFFRAGQNPNIVFTPAEVRGLPSIPSSGTATFQIAGDLAVAGVTRPVVWDVTAQFNGNQIQATATYTFAFAEWGLQKPIVASVLSIADTIPLEVTIAATRS